MQTDNKINFTADKHATAHGQTEGQPVTAVWRNGGFSASYDSFVVGSSVVLRLNFCAEIRHYAKPQNVTCYVKTTVHNDTV